MTRRTDIKVHRFNQMFPVPLWIKRTWWNPKSSLLLPKTSPVNQYAIISTRRVQQKALHRVVCCALGEGCLALVRFLNAAAGWRDGDWFIFEKMRQFTQNWRIRPSKNLGLEVILFGSAAPNSGIWSWSTQAVFQPAGPLGVCRGVTDFEAPNAV